MDRQSEAVKPRARDRENTLSQLKMALHRLQKKNEKISISAVAKEAGVTAALVHNRYPDFAEEIRSAAGKNVRDECASLREKTLAERAKNRLLREQITQLTAEIVKLASLNETMRAQLILQTAIATKKVTRIPITDDSQTSAN